MVLLMSRASCLMAMQMDAVGEEIEKGIKPAGNVRQLRRKRITAA